MPRRDRTVPATGRDRWDERTRFPAPRCCVSRKYRRCGGDRNSMPSACLGFRRSHILRRSAVGSRDGDGDQLPTGRSAATSTALTDITAAQCSAVADATRLAVRWRPLRDRGVRADYSDSDCLSTATIRGESRIWPQARQRTRYTRFPHRHRSPGFSLGNDGGRVNPSRDPAHRRKIDCDRYQRPW